jgi:hypothetical protein
LLSSNARAQATEAMRRAEVEEAARVEWLRFWGHWRELYYGARAGVWRHNALKASNIVSAVGTAVIDSAVSAQTMAVQLSRTTAKSDPCHG